MQRQPHNIATTGSGPEVLLVNGIFQNSKSWSPFARLLSSRFSVTSFEFPNQGDAPAAPEMADRDQYCEVIMEVLRQRRRSPTDTIAVGWSFGANLLIRLASHHDVTFKTLFLITPAPIGFDQYMRDLFEVQLDALHAAAATGLAQTFVPRMFSPSFINSNRGLLRMATMQFVNSYRRRLGALEAILIATEPSPWISAARRWKLTCPAWIVEAEDELILPPRSLRETADLLGCSYICAKGGHACLIEAPEVMAEHFLRAISNLPNLSAVESARQDPGR
jgi:pimeloyl-ACP methyl ester carboxylesterase